MKKLVSLVVVLWLTMSGPVQAQAFQEISGSVPGPTRWKVAITDPYEVSVRIRHRQPGRDYIVHVLVEFKEDGTYKVFQASESGQNK